MNKVVTLSQICDELSDGLHKAPEFNPLGEYLFVNANNLEDGFIIDTNDGRRADESEYQKYKIELNENTILYSIDGSIGRIAKYRGEKCILGKGACYLKVGKQANCDYIYYLLQTKEFKEYIKVMSTGSTIHHISLKTMREYTFQLPELAEQRKIVELPKAIDAKIHNNAKIISEIESLLKMMYDYWFLQYDFPNENGKPYKSSGGKMVWNEELKREIPVGWAVSPIGKLFTTNRGVSYNSATLKGKGIPMVNLASFTPTGAYKIDGIKNYSGDYTEDKVLKPYDLVMCNTQQTAIDFSKDIIGRALLVPDIFEGNIVSSHHVNIIRTVDEALKFYLYYLFNSDYFHKYVTGYANGTNIMGLVFEGVEKYISEIPEKRVLQEFAKLSLSIEKKKSEIIRENQELISLRDFLLPLLMNGQVGFRQDWLKDYKI